jgi:hypothetical protein
VNTLHQVLILSPTFVPEKVGVNRKYAHKKTKVFNMDINDPKCVKQKSTGRKISDVVYWQGVLKQWRKTKRVQNKALVYSNSGL